MRAARIFSFLRVKFGGIGIGAGDMMDKFLDVFEVYLH